MEQKRDYSKGKVYKIEPISDHDEGEIYVGSTAKEYLSQRMTKHRYSYGDWKNGKGRKVMSFGLFEKFGIENCKIILLESVAANTKDELLAREAYYIQTLKCLNKTILGRTKAEYHKQYIEEHKERRQEYMTEYRKDYNNRPEIKEKKSEYYKQKLPCACGKLISKGWMHKHIHSKKHLEFLENNIEK